MKNITTRFGLFKVLGLTLGCAALVLGAIYAGAEPKHAGPDHFHAHGGTTFVIAPTSDPLVFTHTVDGTARVSSLGDCQVHFDVIITFSATAGQPSLLTGTLLITTVDGSTVTATVVGNGTSNPANASFVDFEYQVTFTGGTGPLKHAHGQATVHDGVAFFTPMGLVQPPANAYGTPETGKACWLMDGDLDY